MAILADVACLQRVCSGPPRGGAMLSESRRRFNAAWRPEAYARLRQALVERAGAPLAFKVSETPCFFPRSLLDGMVDTGRALVEQIFSNPEAMAAAAAAVPERFRGPSGEAVPTFLQVDFGLVRTDTGVEPRLVELQAFPSLYAFQLVLAQTYRDVYGLEAGLDLHLGGLDTDGYLALLRTAIVGDGDPEGVVLMEIHPHAQKTRPDFTATERLWGVPTVDALEVVREGGRLFYRRDGALTRIRRIYNRVIPDELETAGLTLPFDYRDDLDVEWAGHPSWYFRVSKFNIPWLSHRAVPATWYLHELEQLPEDRERYLLKPLFSFAGGGIVFAPGDADIAAIPAGRRDRYILQERMAFAPVIDTPDGPTQAEIRIMYVWTDRLRAVLPLVRMGRGRMMGVAHNRNLDWVGASAAFIAEG
jgi:hypothetical protein